MKKRGKNDIHVQFRASIYQLILKTKILCFSKKCDCKNSTTNIYLSKGALFCEMKITDDGVFCVCKNFGFPARHFQISMDKNLIFQRLTDQEQVLLSALDHLSK